MPHVTPQHFKWLQISVLLSALMDTSRILPQRLARLASLNASVVLMVLAAHNARIPTISKETNARPSVTLVGTL